jgi:hypothetical protein
MLLPYILIGLGVGGFIIATPACAIAGLDKESPLNIILFVIPGMVSIMLIFIGIGLL